MEARVTPQYKLMRILVLVSLLFSSKYIILAFASNFVSTSLINTVSTKFGTFIEGTAVDISGNVYAVNFGNANSVNTFGKIQLESKAQSLFFQFDSNTQFNGIRVVCDNSLGEKTFLAADKNKRVIKVVDKKGSVTGSVFCEDSTMLPGVANDLAVDFSNQRVYLSGQAFNSDTVPADGEVWMCTKNGTAFKLSDSTSILGRTNGIELSLDGNILYVSEAINSQYTPVSNKIISFNLNKDGTLIKASRRVFFDFASDNSSNIDIDGMRMDVQGNLFVTRNGRGEIAMISPSGKLIRKISTVGTQYPTNIEISNFTAIVVGRCGNANYGTGVGCIESFSVPYVGRAFSEILKMKDQACLWTNNSPSTSSSSSIKTSTTSLFSSVMSKTTTVSKIPISTSVSFTKTTLASVTSSPT
ncbi:hypothetical protein HK096_002958, partial [Nowakowskiella sp. JEL0078]